MTARSISEFGLPVIHAQPVQRVAEPELVTVVELRHVGRERVRPLVALDRRPAIVIADGAETGQERGHARVARVAAEVRAAIRARDSQRVQAVVAKRKVSGGGLVGHLRDAIRGVEDGRRIEGPRSADRVLVYRRVARQHVGLVPEVRLRRIDRRTHVRVLAPDLPRGRGVVVDLEVVVVAIEVAVGILHEVPRDRGASHVRPGSSPGGWSSETGPESSPRSRRCSGSWFPGKGVLPVPSALPVVGS